MVDAIETMKVNAAGKSCDFATCPFFRASRNFFGVAASVFSAIIPYKRLKNAMIPNPKMRIPAIRFTHTMIGAVICLRKRVTPSLKRIHQKQDPTNTPDTR